MEPIQATGVTCLKPSKLTPGGVSRSSVTEVAATSSVPNVLGRSRLRKAEKNRFQKINSGVVNKNLGTSMCLACHSKGLARIEDGGCMVLMVLRRLEVLRGRRRSLIIFYIIFTPLHGLFLLNTILELY